MKTDWKLLAQQKATLVDLLENGLLDRTQKEHLQGLVHFLDATQDMAADRAPEDVVYIHEDGYRDGNGTLVGQNDWSPGTNWLEISTTLVNSEDGTGCDGVSVVDLEAYNEFAEAVAEIHKNK